MFGVIIDGCDAVLSYEFLFFFQAEDGIRDGTVTGVQTCALPISNSNVVCGLPFHHRQGGRMVDVILVPEGEKQTTFELGISLDRDVPMQTALGYTSPLAIIRSEERRVGKECRARRAAQRYKKEIE